MRIGLLRRGGWIGGLAGLALIVALPAEAWAQGMDIAAGGGDSPLEVTAEDGIEWRQDEKMFLAQGNARAVRGDTAVQAGELRAHYRQPEDGDPTIWKLDAIGNVVITQADRVARGHRATYDLETGVFSLTGGGPSLVSGADSVTARDALEYRVQAKQAVAKGGAKVVQGDRLLFADRLTADFADNKAGDTEISRVEAQGNVRLETKEEVVIADRGVYTVTDETIILDGSVEITRGKNQLRGCGAVVNLKTGVSRLTSCKEGSGERVQGVIFPEKDQKNPLDKQ
ncbi:MAG: LptA/OstA family protein [Magnetospiraceae bacterium]